MNAGDMAMPEFRDDFWEELEMLEAQRAEIQMAHDDALGKLFASRSESAIASPEAFDEYSAHSDKLSAAMTKIQEFREKYTPYK